MQGKSGKLLCTICADVESGGIPHSLLSTMRHYHNSTKQDMVQEGALLSHELSLKKVKKLVAKF